MSLTNPSDALPYVRAIQLLIGGYGAYSRERRREDDVAVREEILRAANRIRHHLNNVHDAAYRDEESSLAGACARAIEEVDALKNDVDKAATGGEHPLFSLQKSPSKKTIGKLVTHDHFTLKMVTKAVRASNEVEVAAANSDEADGGEEGTSVKIAECQRLVSSCRGHFSERNKILRNVR